MGTIAAINVAVNADTQNFMNGMDRAAKKTEEFNAKILSSRQSLQTFAGIADVNAGALGHLVHAFEVMPGPIGVVIGAVFALKEAFNDLEAMAKKSAETQQRAFETLADARKAAGDTKTFEGLAGEPDKEIQKIEERIKELNKDMAAARESHNPLTIFTFQDTILKDSQIIKNLDQEEQRWVQMRSVLDSFQNQMEHINRAKLKIDMEGGDKLPLLQKQADLLEHTLPEAFDPKVARELQRELDAVNKEMADIDKHAMKKVAEREKREEDDAEKALEGKENNRFEEAIQKALDNAKKLKEAVETPAEKFEEHMTAAFELFDKGFIDETTLIRYQNQQYKEFAKADNKESLSLGAKFEQFDAGRINVAGLAMQSAKKQEITSQQLDVTNAILTKIAAKYGYEPNFAEVAKD